jgi:Domain of unknown function (DUF4170)
MQAGHHSPIIRERHHCVRTRPLPDYSGEEAHPMAKQLLHLVFGGELVDPNGTEFADLSKLDIVGIYPNYRTACQAWRAKAQQTVDDAHTRYFVVHLHRLLDPESETPET